MFILTYHVIGFVQKMTHIYRINTCKYKMGLNSYIGLQMCLFERCALTKEPITWQLLFAVRKQLFNRNQH